ncbi:DUF4350 domain-containing protein [Novosphingobium barchaimii]|uniref:DUF4350 domain-containing protein n=1 Tax=Novosphingobium barchaimii TaxID=1420591 RepID=UPI0011DFF456|nr:DUF4350 domain-containing protein [Novosphingobium barchaimii]
MRRPRLELILLAVLALAGCGKRDAALPRGSAVIGLYTSLPITWNESPDIRGLLAEQSAPHWALEVLRGRGPVTPLDTLAPLRLPEGAVLVLAQPRPLTPQENVALDAWVQAGGRVLLLADPMLTVHSRFAPGDPRRPQDIAMLSPILGRWGLELAFDDAQPAGEHTVRLPDGDVPVNLPGFFRAAGNSEEGGKSGKVRDAVAHCRLEAAGLLADCIAGKGRVIALADAALLEISEDSQGLAQRQAILGRLLDRLSDSARASK